MGEIKAEKTKVYFPTTDLTVVRIINWQNISMHRTMRPTDLPRQCTHAE